MSSRNRAYYYNILKNANIITKGWRHLTVPKLKSLLIEHNLMDDKDNLIDINVESKVYDTDIGMIDQSRPNEEYVMYNFEEYSDYRIVNDISRNHIIQSLKNIINITYVNLVDKDVHMQIRLYGSKDHTFVYSSVYKPYYDLINTIDDFIGDLNERYNDEDFVISHASVNYIKNTHTLIGEYRINEEKAHDKWFIIDHKTKKNCLFVCLNVALKWKKNKKLLVDERYRIQNTDNNFLKDNDIPKHIIHYPCISHLKDLSKILKVNIYVYNSIYNITNRIIYDNCLEVIHIQISENHAKLLLEKKKVWELYPLIKDDDIYILDKKNNKLKNIHKPFYKIKYEDEIDNNIITWDIETYSTKNKIYVYSISLFGSKHKAVFTNKLLLHNIHPKTKEIFNENVFISGCMYYFVHYLKKNHSSLNNHTFYAHNGSKYDIIFLLKEVILYDKEIKIIPKSVIETNNRFLNISIQIEKSIITFKDSYALLPYSLYSLCISFNTKNSKLDIEIEKLKKLDKIIEYFDEIVTYNIYDVISLHDILIKFNEHIFKIFKLNITKSTTIATLARNILRTEKYYTNELFNIPDYVEEFVKKSYFGGRTECFILGHISDNINCYDINSSYIYSGIKPLPLGKSIRIKENTIEDVINNPLYKQSFVKVLVKLKNNINLDNFIPLHPVKNKDGLILYPIIKDWIEMVLYLPELKLGVKVGYEYKFIEGFYFKSSYSLKKIFNHMYEERIKYDKSNILNFVYKLIGVSLYGCFGYNVLNKTNIKISNKNSKDHVKYLKKYKLKNTSIIGNYELNEVISDIDIDRNYAIASAITSYGRIRLYEIYLDIKSKGFNIFYSDTDSVFTNINLEDFPDLRDKYNLNTNILGALKNETNPSCNDGYIIGNKKYVFTNKIFNIIKTSFNGVMYNNDFDDDKYDDNFIKLSISDKNNVIKENLIIDIFNNKNIIRQQNYFISNKNLYLNNSNPFNVNWYTINIEFNKIIYSREGHDFNIQHQYLKKYKKGFINDFTKITNELYSVKPYILYKNYIYKGIDDNCGSLFYRKY